MIANDLRNIHKQFPASVPVCIVRAAERAHTAAAQWSALADWFDAPDGVSPQRSYLDALECDRRAGMHLEAYFRLVDRYAKGIGQ